LSHQYIVRYIDMTVLFCKFLKRCTVIDMFHTPNCTFALIQNCSSLRGLLSFCSKCEQVIDEWLQGEKYKLCDRCDCQWQRRNTVTIKVRNEEKKIKIHHHNKNKNYNEKLKYCHNNKSKKHHRSKSREYVHESQQKTEIPSHKTARWYIAHLCVTYGSKW